MTNKVALVVAVVLGIISVLGIKAYVDRIKQTQQFEVEKLDVMVATRILKPGAVVAEGDYELQQFPQDTLRAALQDSWKKSPDDVLGRIVRARVRPGQVLLDAHFQSEGSSDRIAFERSERAVTTPVDRIAGLAGHLRPRDRIDIIVSLEIGGESLTNTLFSEVRVLATDTSISPFGPGIGRYTTLTLALPPEACNELLWVLNNGARINCLLTKRNALASQGANAVDGPAILKRIRGS